MGALFLNISPAFFLLVYTIHIVLSKGLNSSYVLRSITMKKTIRKIGDSLGIIFNSEEQAINNLKKGKIVNIEINISKHQIRAN